MGWVRHVIIDIAVVVVIALATFGGQEWAKWIVWIYTPLMLLLKLAALSADVAPKKGDVPDWFYHVTYAASVVILLYHAWYWETAGWIAIWLLSVVAASRGTSITRPTKK